MRALGACEGGGRALAVRVHVCNGLVFIKLGMPSDPTTSHWMPPQVRWRGLLAQRAAMMAQQAQAQSALAVLYAWPSWAYPMR